MIKSPVYHKNEIRYAKRAPVKMKPFKDFLLPYINNKKIIDWGGGPGHRSKVLLDWGAAEVSVWDPAPDSKELYNFFYKDRLKNLKWFEGSINFDELTNIYTDILFVAELHQQASDNPYNWWKNLINKIYAKYYICMWHTGGTNHDTLARDGIPLFVPNTNPNHFSMYSETGWNEEPGEKVFRCDSRLVEIAHKISYPPEHYSFNHVPMQLLLLERKN